MQILKKKEKKKQEKACRAKTCNNMKNEEKKMFYLDSA